MLNRRNFATAVAGYGVALGVPAWAQVGSRNIKFTLGVTEDHPVSVGIKKMQEVLAVKAGGKMKISTFWGGSAGGDLQAVQALRAGTQEMVCTSSSPLVGIVKELGVFDLPFLFANEKEADAVFDGEAGRYFDKKLEAAGLINLGFWENGFRNFTNSKHPVNKVEDFDGLKIRVMQNNIFLDSFKSLKTNPIPMAFGEIYTALETRTIDGQENPFLLIETAKFNEVQKYLSITKHAYTPFLILYSKKLWDKLSPEEQALVREAAKEGKPVQRQASRSMSAKSLDSLRKTMVVNEVPEAERMRMHERVRQVYEKQASVIGSEAMGVVMDALKKVRAAA